MASTPPPTSTCPYSSTSGFPGCGGGNNGNGATPGMAGSLLDASPTSGVGCPGMIMGDSSFLSSQSCDVVMQTTAGGGGPPGGGCNNTCNRRSDRYKDTRQMYETNGTYVIPEDEVC